MNGPLAFMDKCRATHVKMQMIELGVGRNNFDKAKNRFKASTKSQFESHHGYQRNFINPLVPSMSFYPDFIQILFKFYLDFIIILSRFFRN